MLCVLVTVAWGYSTKYDNIDIDEILTTDRLLQMYIKCLLDQGKCNGEGKFLKEIVPDAIQTDCSNCNEIQSKNARKVLQFFGENMRPTFDKLAAKYDPEGKYTENYMKYVEGRV